MAPPFCFRSLDQQPWLSDFFNIVYKQEAFVAARRYNANIIAAAVDFYSLHKPQQLQPQFIFSIHNILFDNIFR